MQKGASGGGHLGFIQGKRTGQSYHSNCSDRTMYMYFWEIKLLLGWFPLRPSTPGVLPCKVVGQFQKNVKEKIFFQLRK